MRRIGLILVIGAAVLGAAAPANAQIGFGDTQCIPTSDTPLQSGSTEPVPAFSFYVLLDGFNQLADATNVKNPDGTFSFRAGLPQGTYALLLVIGDGEFVPREFVPLGFVQIGNCPPPPPPSPTTKEQCKNGEWQSFTAFKNQGECIAFVNRGVKPSPA